MKKSDLGHTHSGYKSKQGNWFMEHYLEVQVCFDVLRC